jgi:hypothetical protein
MTASTDSPRTLWLGGVLILIACIAVGVFLSLGRRESHVSGRVTLDGELVGGAQIVFFADGAEHPAPLIAQSEGDGRYILIGSHAGGITPGKYKVIVSKMAFKNGTLPKGEQLEQARADGTLINLLPAVYEERNTTPLSFEIPSGISTIDLTLTRKK